VSQTRADTASGASTALTNSTAELPPPMLRCLARFSTTRRWPSATARPDLQESTCAV
jgi:hypothetical protein